MNARLHRRVIFIFSLLALLALACSFSTLISQETKQPDGQVETQIAFGIQSTQLAEDRAQLNLDQTAAAVMPIETIAPPTAEPATAEPAPTWTPIAVEPTAEPPTPEAVDMTDRIRGANVLVYEDVRGYPDLETRVSMAVRTMRFKGGKVIEVGDALGVFMENLNSGVKWDLIVVAAEARNTVRGEFWDIIYDQVSDGTALVAEMWYLDEISGGRINPLLRECGVRVQKDWSRDPYTNDDPQKSLNYSIYWLDNESEVFYTPNMTGQLTTPNLYWSGDVGDLLMLRTEGDAQMIAGLYPNRKTDNGVLASCLGGRMILQTYSTHDYRQDKTVPLWENFMTVTLTHHFEYMDAQK